MIWGVINGMKVTVCITGLLHYSSFEQDELAGSAQQIERYLVGRGGGKRHTIAGAPPQQPGPDSPRRRRTGLMTVMEKPPNIPPDLVQVSQYWLLIGLLWKQETAGLVLKEVNKLKLKLILITKVISSFILFSPVKR